MTATVAPSRGTRSSWLPVVGLLLLSLIPILAGAARLGELSGGVVETAQNARFVDSPIPVVTHLVSVTVFSLLGALQFVPALRRGRARWHRTAGLLLIPAGALTALSGMWMAVFYQLPVGDGTALLVLRLLFGSAMLASIVLAVRAIIRRDFVTHGSWMTRAYAIALGAGTQALLLIPEGILFGAHTELPRTVVMGTAWLLNLAVAEWVIRRRAAVRGVTR